MAGVFKKVCRVEEEEGARPFPGVLEMRVKEGSKIRNLMGFAMTRMQDQNQTLRQVVFSGSGRAVTKTITCAEIMKRKIGGLHQVTKLQHKGEKGGGVGTSVHRTLPSISILLSKDPLDPLEPGYQPPQRASWEEKSAGEPSEEPTEPPAKRTCV